MSARLRRELSELQASLKDEGEKVNRLQMELASKESEIEHLLQKVSVQGGDTSSVNSSNELDDDSLIGELQICVRTRSVDNRVTISAISLTAE